MGETSVFFVLFLCVTLAYVAYGDVTITKPVDGNENVTVQENAATILTLSGTSDGRQSDNSSAVVTYNITQQTPEDYFTVDITTGVVSLAEGKTLDFESGVKMFVLTVVLTDNAVPQGMATGTVTILITNANDEHPILNIMPNCVSVGADIAADAVIGTYNATDKDGSLNPLTYSIASGDDEGAEKFNYGSDTGTLKKTDVPFNVTEKSNYTLVLRVSDGENEGNGSLIVLVGGQCVSSVTNSTAILGGMPCTFLAALICLFLFTCLCITN